MIKEICAFTIFLAGLIVGLHPVPAIAFDDAITGKVTYPPWFKQTFYDLAEDLSDAKEGGQRGILVFFSTQGCSYCQLLIQRTFADPKLGQRLQADFDVIGMEMFADIEITDWNGRVLPVKDFAVREGAQFAPTLNFYDTSGELLLRLVGYYGPERFAQVLDYLTYRQSGDLAFKDWLERKQRASPPVPPARTEFVADPLFAAPPYQLDRSRNAATRPLLVIFDKQACAECVSFHREVLTDPQVRELLSEFEVVRLDSDDVRTRVVTPTGAPTTPAQWREDVGFTRYPALAWFDEQGKRVLETDALVHTGRMLNALGFVRDRAYEKGWTYQRYARHQALQRLAREQSRADKRSGR